MGRKILVVMIVALVFPIVVLAGDGNSGIAPAWKEETSQGMILHFGALSFDYEGDVPEAVRDTVAMCYVNDTLAFVSVEFPGNFTCLKDVNVIGGCCTAIGAFDRIYKFPYGCCYVSVGPGSAAQSLDGILEHHGKVTNINPDIDLPEIDGGAQTKILEGTLDASLGTYHFIRICNLTQDIDLMFISKEGREDFLKDIINSISLDFREE